MASKGTNYLTKENFDDCPVWRFDDKDNLNYPVQKPEDMPSDPRDTRIKAVFYAPNGMEFNGYIVGVDRVFTVYLFYQGKKFGFNNNAVSLCYEDFNQLMELLPNGSIRDKDDLFPLRYETRFDWEDRGYKNFWGEFDAFIKERQPQS